MVSGVDRADPGSVSRLGGALRTSAARLAADRADLGADSPLATLSGVVVERLDEMGSALQAHSQELAELTVGVSRLADRVAAEGLTLDGWRVIEPYGVATSEVAARRQAAQAPLQAQADRLRSRLGRARAHLERSLDAASLALDGAARTARGLER